MLGSRAGGLPGWGSVPGSLSTGFVSHPLAPLAAPAARASVPPVSQGARLGSRGLGLWRSPPGVGRGDLRTRKRDSSGPSDRGSAPVLLPPPRAPRVRRRLRGPRCSGGDAGLRTSARGGPRCPPRGVRVGPAPAPRPRGPVRPEERAQRSHGPPPPSWDLPAPPSRNTPPPASRTPRGPRARSGAGAAAKCFRTRSPTGLHGRDRH